jgi:hypothetical protein
MTLDDLGFVVSGRHRHSEVRALWHPQLIGPVSTKKLDYDKPDPGITPMNAIDLLCAPTKTLNRALRNRTGGKRPAKKAI